MQDSKYIDCHVHILPEKRSRKLMKWVKSFMPDHPVNAEISNEEIASDLIAAGADRWVNLLYPIWPDESRELNRHGTALAKRYPASMTFGGVWINDADPLNIVREAIEEFGFEGIKFHPMVQRFSPAAPELAPIYPYLEKRARAVYIHTGYDQWYNWTLPQKDIEWIVKSHPGLGVVLSHIAFPQIEWALDLAEKKANVWLDATNVFGTFALMKKIDAKSLAPESDTASLSKIFAQYVPKLKDRIIFGTDHPAGLGDIRQILDDVHGFGLDENTLKNILFEAPAIFFEKYKVG